jgi:hypothetical protein
MSHQALLDQKLNGKLPEGGRAVTIFKENGEIHVHDSRGVHGHAGPSPPHIRDGIREQIE